MFLSHVDSTYFTMKVNSLIKIFVYGQNKISDNLLVVDKNKLSSDWDGRHKNCNVLPLNLIFHSFCTGKHLEVL